MKKLLNNSNQVVKTILLTIILSFHLAVNAEDGWVMVFQNADGELQEIPMSEVGSLVAVDNAYDFSILSANGNVLAEGILKVSFEQKGSVGIREIKSDRNLLGKVVSDKITLIGVAGEISVFDVAGIQQAKVTATGGETVINIANMPSGVYVVKAGKQTFKFIKK